jgi:hypothetical protein
MKMWGGWMREMRKEPPIAECTFGWGQVFRLYSDYIDVNGTPYALSDLTHFRPVYQHVMGISSVRLELRFGKRNVTLRGIAAIDDAQKAVDYLNSHYLRLGKAESRKHKRVKWNRINEEHVPQHVQQIPVSSAGQLPIPVAMQSEETVLEPEIDLITQKERRLQERVQAPTLNVETPNWQRFRQDQRERRQKRLHTERELREHGFDVDQLAERLHEQELPVITVPMRLSPGESAYYSTPATLCGEPIGGPLSSTYPAKDHGTLILTNKRLVFLGRKGQVVLDYARLSSVERLRGAVAIEAAHWYKQEIFEVRLPLECAMYVENLLQRWKRTSSRTQFRKITNNFFDNCTSSEEALPAVDINTVPLPTKRSRSLVEALESRSTQNGWWL